MNNQLKKLIREHAQEIETRYSAIKKTYEEKSKDSRAKTKWEEACRKFHSSYDQLAFPGGLAAGVEQLKNGDPAAIETAIVFLSTDPYFFRSGYIKETILRYLNRVVLNKKQIEQVQAILLERIAGEGRREFRSYCRLAKKVIDEAFIAKIQKLLLSENKNVSSRAKIMLATIN